MILSFSVLDELPYTWTISLRGHSENLPALRKKIDTIESENLQRLFGLSSFSLASLKVAYHEVQVFIIRN